MATHARRRWTLSHRRPGVSRGRHCLPWLLTPVLAATLLAVGVLPMADLAVRQWAPVALPVTEPLAATVIGSDTPPQPAGNSRAKPVANRMRAPRRKSPVAKARALVATTPIRQVAAVALYRTAPTAARTDPTPISSGGLTGSIDVARLNQAAIDACGPAVLRSGPLPGLGSGTSWLAGHDFCGFDTWNHLPIGALLTIHDATGTFNGASSLSGVA